MRKNHRLQGPDVAGAQLGICERNTNRVWRAPHAGRQQAKAYKESAQCTAAMPRKRGQTLTINDQDVLAVIHLET